MKRLSLLVLLLLSGCSNSVTVTEVPTKSIDSIDSTNSVCFPGPTVIEAIDENNNGNN